MMNFQEFLTTLAKAHSFKAGASLVGSYVMLQILPIAQFLAVGIVLVCCDWVTGVWAAWKRKETITSKGLRRTVEKVVMYSLAICLVLIVETVFFGTHFLVGAASLYISLVELFSNLENISSITGNNLVGAIKMVLFKRFPFLEKLLQPPMKEGE